MILILVQRKGENKKMVKITVRRAPKYIKHADIKWGVLVNNWVYDSFRTKKQAQRAIPRIRKKVS